MIRASFWHRQKFFPLPVCLVLVAIGDYFFYGHTLGWGTAVFAGIAASAVAMRAPSLWKQAAGRIVLALTALLLLALVGSVDGSDHRLTAFITLPQP